MGMLRYSLTLPEFGGKVVRGASLGTLSNGAAGCCTAERVWSICSRFLPIFHKTVHSLAKLNCTERVKRWLARSTSGA
jgi:hypothetical protein